MTILPQLKLAVVFIQSVNRYSYCVVKLHKYKAHIKVFSKCFLEVQAKNDVTDNKVVTL